MDEAASREERQRDPPGTRPGAAGGVAGPRPPSGAAGLGERGGLHRGAGWPWVRARRDEQGRGSGDYFAFSVPQEKKKKKSWREAERTATLISSSGCRGKARAAAAGTRRGTGLTNGVNRSRPRPAEGPGRRPPARPSPPPRAGRPREAVQLSPLQRPLGGRPGPGCGVGAGRGFPAGEPSPGAGGGGEGTGPGTGGLRRTRARHEHGPREGSWVKSGRAAPGERGEEPGSEVRALEPGLQSPRPTPTGTRRAGGTFLFSPGLRAPLLTELPLRGRGRGQLLADLLTPPPCHHQHTTQLYPAPPLTPQPPGPACNNAVNLL